MDFLNDFPLPSMEEWRDVVADELGGDGVDANLTWTPYEEFIVQPLYTRRDMEGVAHASFLPGIPPYVRGEDPLGFLGRGWTVVQKIREADPRRANAHARSSVAAGATGLHLVLSDGTAPGTVLRVLDDARMLLDGVPLDRVVVTLYPNTSHIEFLALMLEAADVLGARRADVRIRLCVDPFSMLCMDGVLPAHPDAVFTTLSRIISEHDAGAAQGILACVSSEPYHNAGANAVQESAFTIAAGVETLRSLIRGGVTVDQAARSMEFTVAVGTNVFFEIAKLRALRLLWAKIVKQFEPQHEASMGMRIHVATSEWSRTVYDPYGNILRATVETMAGAIGGARSIHTVPFASGVNDPDALPQRNARNTSHILREESHLDAVADPAAGSYYIEAITDRLARNAWEMFQDVERKGGFLEALRTGHIQDAVARVREVRDENIAHRRDVFVGSTKYPNHLERIQRKGEEMQHPRRVDANPSHVREDSVPPAGMPVLQSLRVAFASGVSIDQMQPILFGNRTDAAIVVRPLMQYHGAEQFERMRLAMDALSKPLAVMLIPLGSLHRRRQRAAFAAGFFGVAGCDIIDSAGFDSVDDAAQAAVASHAEIIVLCGDDREYPTVVPALSARVKAAHASRLLVVAGDPGENESLLRAAGADAFISARSNAVETLREILTRCGITID